MRTSLYRFGFMTMSSVLVSLACGSGGQGTTSKTPSTAAKSDGQSGSPSSVGGGAGSEGSAASSDVTGGTTTTTQLGDGGDLQGAKLGSSVHTTTESKGDGGPKSTHGQSAGEPGRSAKDIQALVAAHRDEARACYDKALAAHPGIEGDLDITWVIDPQGNVNDASVDTAKSQILEPSVGACVADVIKKIRFNASAKGYETRTHYPFNFHPKTFRTKDAGR